MLLILAAIATCISILNLKRWNESDPDTTRAKAFLNPSFMGVNFKLTLIAVGLVFIHFIAMEYEELYEIRSTATFEFIYYASFIGSMLALVLLVCMWHKLLNKKKK